MSNYSKQDAIEILEELQYISRCIHDLDLKYALGRIRDLAEDIYANAELTSEDNVGDWFGTIGGAQ